MGTVEVDISMSVDGFITGPQLDEHPGLGLDGDILHAWFKRDPDGPALLDDALFATSGAVITSRKIYEDMHGWGDDGFYGMPVFVLTHRPHDPVVKGRTQFNFVTEGIDVAISQAQAVAGAKKVHVMGGATVVQQAINAGLVDSIHLHLAPIVLGAGTRLFAALTGSIQLERTQLVESQFGTHIRFRVLQTIPRPEGARPARDGTHRLRLAHVATRLPAQDLARARAFYSETLGLDPIEERPGGLRYQCAEGWFALFESSGRPSGGHTQMAFEVDDLDAVVADLRTRGLVFEDYEMPGLHTVDGIATVDGNYLSTGTTDERAAWFHDSEGNLLALGQPVRADRARLDDEP